jgi:uncharacterized short protein YbdD (DUF466 family)
MAFVFSGLTKIKFCQKKVENSACFMAGMCTFARLFKHKRSKQPKNGKTAKKRTLYTKHHFVYQWLISVVSSKLSVL